MLPEAIWDRLVILRSSPGAGKTSMMRLFNPENLIWVLTRVEQNEPVRQKLLEIGAIDANRPLKLGVLIEIDSAYRSLLDVTAESGERVKLFLRLLDVRILVGVLKSALKLGGLDYPEEVGEVKFDSGGNPRIEALLKRLGGSTGSEIYQYAQVTEESIIHLLDAYLATEVGNIPEGHSELYSLSVLAESRIYIGNDPLDAQPMVMFDDGHELHGTQREVLLDNLRRRRPAVARWYSERFEALSDQELLSSVGEEDRDVKLVNLDAIARDGSKDGKRFTQGRFPRVLGDIARRRAEHQLSMYAQEDQDFLSLLEDDWDLPFSSKEEDIITALKAHAIALGVEDSRYAYWLNEAHTRRGFDAAICWRELQILIYRDKNRQQDLFNAPLSIEEFMDRSSPAIREGAAVSIAEEFRVPYYAGDSLAVKLGSHNTRQFLKICGDLFAEMLVDISLGRRPRLDVTRQHRVLRNASEQLWRSIPRTVPHGRDVQALVREIVEIARTENKKPSMPYPPGVTGTALLMDERNLLLDADYRNSTPGAERFLAALASAIAHNVIQASLDHSVKNQRYMVLYLNRLLCPRFYLPLGYGGFRERRLKVMAGWLSGPPAPRMEQALPNGDLTLDFWQ